MAESVADEDKSGEMVILVGPKMATSDFLAHLAASFHESYRDHGAVNDMETEIGDFMLNGEVHSVAVTFRGDRGPILLMAEEAEQTIAAAWAALKGHDN